MFTLSIVTAMKAMLREADIKGVRSKSCVFSLKGQISSICCRVFIAKLFFFARLLRKFELVTSGCEQSVESLSSGVGLCTTIGSSSDNCLESNVINGKPIAFSSRGRGAECAFTCCRTCRWPSIFYDTRRSNWSTSGRRISWTVTRSSHSA